jgi:hypothetical protein
METYNNNFLTQERKTLEDTLLQVAIKIRDKIKESKHNYLLTQGSSKTPILDSLYGYIYGEGEDMDVYEREVKGFRVTSEGELWICMDLSSVKYDELTLVETYEDIDDDVWYPLLESNNTLVNTDCYNVYLTLLSISECVYQYFE